MGPTEALANYIAQVKLSDFPSEVVLQGKHCIQNIIGCALGGAQTELGQRQIALGKKLGGESESTLIGDGTKTSSVFAAYTNAEVADALDFEDIDWPSLSHPGCPIVASALAIGEAANASGKDLLTAVIVGYEAGIRIARAMLTDVTLPNGKRDRLQNHSYHVLAATIASSKLLGLNAEEISNALGIAGSTPINRGQTPVFAAGLAGSSSHPYFENKYDVGVYTLMGVFSTLRSQKIQGIKNILDGERFSRPAGFTTYDPSAIVNNLGKEYRIMDVFFKPIPFCAQVIRFVTDVWEALKGETLSPRDIEEITLTSTIRLPSYKWETMVEAQFSTPCGVAMAVAGYEPGPKWYTTGRYKEPDILEIASKVKFVEDPEDNDIYLVEGRHRCTAEIKTKDGRIRRAHSDYEKGSPQNPLTED